jgi:hypothetical protein
MARRSISWIVALAACALALPRGADAQVPMVFGSWNAGVQAGVSVPSGTSADDFDLGWTAAAWLAYHPIGATLSVRALISYQRFDPADSSSLTSAANVMGYTGELVARLPALGVRPYLLGGAGAYNRTDFGTRFGWHAGGGFAFSFLERTLLLEARYLNVTGSGEERLRTFPITLGLVF